jgi:hypothetical protein
MINKKNIQEYFELMKSKNIIADYWNFDNFLEESEHVKIYYSHKSGKRSSFRFTKEMVIQELRDNKLKKIFD